MIPKRFVLAAIVIFGLLGGPAMAVEEPDYHTALQDGVFEIRDYPGLVVAEVAVNGAQKEAASRGFRLLAGYIFGGNDRRQRIAMTAPVAQEPTGERISAAPVSQLQRAKTWIVQFTMPRGSSLETLPAPSDSHVHLRKTPPTRFAVVRFSGTAAPGDVAEKTRELLAWMARRHLHPAGPPALAQYDPPWTLWFMRRNEMMIPLSP